MANEQVWVVAACFNEAEVIGALMERVMALSEVDHLLLIDDGSSDATVAVIRAWQKSHADQAVTTHTCSLAINARSALFGTVRLPAQS